jgi:hypothetical protein
MIGLRCFVCESVSVSACQKPSDLTCNFFWTQEDEPSDRWSKKHAQPPLLSNDLYQCALGQIICQLHSV